MRLASLGALLLAFWLLLSGHYTPLLLLFGALAVLLGVTAAKRMGTADEEGLPLHLVPRGLTYWPWLVWEIVKAAWAVSKVIIDPRLPISPTMTVVRASQRTTAGVATYANSITLTPGTITTRVEDDLLVVHALVRDGALDVEGGVMDKRVCKFEGEA